MTRVYMSFGGGVQSTTIAMLALNKDRRLLDVTGGKVPQMYLFADTGDEREAIYGHVWDMACLFSKEGIDFLIAYQGDLSAHIIDKALSGKSGLNSLPFWVKGVTGKPTPVRRACTSVYKVQILDKTARRYWNVKRSPRGQRGGYLEKPVQQWLGISYDEMQRLKVSMLQWRTFFYPLVEMKWTRNHCIKYLESLGIKPMRSSCVFCPFHGQEEWASIKKVGGNDWDKVLMVERAVEEGFRKHGSVGGLLNQPYLSKHLKRIEDIDFDDQDQLSFFDMECFGVCGV